MKFKKLLAFTLASTMVAGSSLTVFAAEGDTTDPNTGSLSGSGEVEGTVSSDVWNVVLPTLTTGETTYDFILDPEGLIAKTNNAKYADAQFEENATLYFKSKDKVEVSGAQKDNYTSTSDSKTITNKSTTDVDVTLTATVTPGEGITMNSDKTFADDTNASVYLALTNGDDTNPNVSAVDSDNTAVLTTKMAKAADGAYEIQWNDTDKKYEYVETDAAKADDYSGYSKFSFALTGACNAKGDWSELAAAAPSVEVVWAVAPHQDNVEPSIESTGTYNKSTGVITVGVNLGAGTGLTTLSSAKYGSSLANATYDVLSPVITNNTFTGTVKDNVISGWSKLNGPFYAVITLADGTTQNVTLTAE